MDEEDDEDSRPLMQSEVSVESGCNDEERQNETPAVGHDIRRRLYTSHLLSAWNSRAFEFGAFLFLANIFPQTLLPASVYALARAGSAALLSPWIGDYIDRTERLSAVQLSIICQRTAVAFSCTVLFALVNFNSISQDYTMTFGALAVLSTLACIEKLGAVLNTISVERDWVVVIAQRDQDSLRTINSQMRRIDLFCKLFAPLAVSFVDTTSSTIAILAVGGTAVISAPVEYFAIAAVYKAVPALRIFDRPIQVVNPRPRGFLVRVKDALSSTLTYFRHSAFLPSFSLTLLYLTVLSFNGQLITYLIAIGVKSKVIGLLRGVSALFELSATWIAPAIMQRIGPVRSGIWFINGEICCVALACLFFWLHLSPTFAAVGTVSAVIASRIGLWGFDLSAQIIVQEEVESELRGTFSSQEFAFQNIFEMLSFASTIAFARPAQFKYPATISAAAVGIAGVLYAAFVRARRGHLIHLSRCMDRHVKHAGLQGWRRVPQNERPLDYELA